MSKVLVIYSTNAGSTAEVASYIAESLTACGHNTESKNVTDVTDLSRYDAIILGAPMIFGWHAAMRRFLKWNAGVLATKKVAYFACAMRLTMGDRNYAPELPVALDPNLVQEQARPGKLSLKERFTTTHHYLEPLGLAILGGKLELYRLKWWQAGFVMLVVQAVPGDYRDWDFIKSWAQMISELL